MNHREARELYDKVIELGINKSTANPAAILDLSMQVTDDGYEVFISEPNNSHSITVTLTDLLGQHVTDNT